MKIRAAGPSDQSAIETIVAAAFDEEPDGRVVQMIRALNRARATRISLVADDDGIVGHIQLSKAWIDTRQRLVDALMLTPLSVAPEHQRQGIGTRLVQEALKAAHAGHCDIVRELIDGRTAADPVGGPDFVSRIQAAAESFR